uniref:50S ribosomal protein L14e n=1 Tax=uncultured korarchaeote TaxID=161241 RepID=A0A1L2JK79_9CREN|nr:ribosomal protein L14E/L6E/L27E [uncultured korarchaeote]
MHITGVKMSLFVVGRVCTKTKGREKDRKCVIVDVIDKNYVLITGPKKLTGVRRRRCNINHLDPLPVVIDIDKNASDEDVIKALSQTEIYKEFTGKGGKS